MIAPLGRRLMKRLLLLLRSPLLLSRGAVCAKLGRGDFALVGYRRSPCCSV